MNRAPFGQSISDLLYIRRFHGTENAGENRQFLHGQSRFEGDRLDIVDFEPVGDARNIDARVQGLFIHVKQIAIENEYDGGDILKKAVGFLLQIFNGLANHWMILAIHQGAIA
jgi:hypothetical protein